MPEKPMSSRIRAAVIVLSVLVLALVALYCFSNNWVILPINKSPSAVTRNELTQLAASLQAFKLHCGTYPPSKIKLCSDSSEYDRKDPLDRESLLYLARIWPQLGNFRGIAWDGRQLPAAGVVLEGDQCLVFFLGGIPDQAKPGCLGFSKDPQNPANPAADIARRKYFDFAPNRLVRTGDRAFCSYRDSFGDQPYAYFSSGHRADGYNAHGSTDCPRLGVWPYAKALEPKPAYHNPNSFQIISAGPDGRFGIGTVLPGGKPWTEENADQIDEPGRDDLSNFHSGLPLGVPLTESDGSGIGLAAQIGGAIACVGVMLLGFVIVRRLLWRDRAARTLDVARRSD